MSKIISIFTLALLYVTITFGQAAVENLYADSPYAGEEDFEPPAAPLVEYLGGKPDDITVIVGRVA